MTVSSSVDPWFLFVVGAAKVLTSYNTHCDYSGSDCYQARIVASIESLSAQTGYTTGGQVLNINGYGLKNQDISVTIDGIPCTVTSNSSDQITCLTGAKSTASSAGVY